MTTTTKRMEGCLTRQEACILKGVLEAVRNLQGFKKTLLVVQPRKGVMPWELDEMVWEVWAVAPSKRVAVALYQVSNDRVPRILKASREGKLPTC